MNPRGFPPLPPPPPGVAAAPPRIAVDRADLLPEPRLEVRVDAAVRPAAAAVAMHAAVLAVAAILWGAVAWAAVEQWANGAAAGAALLLGLSGTVVAGAAAVLWAMKDGCTRLAVTATADEAVFERIWWGRVRTDRVPLTPWRGEADGSEDGGPLPRVWDPQPTVIPFAVQPLRWRPPGSAAGTGVVLTPRLPGPERAWLIAALARVAAAAGRPVAVVPALEAAPAVADGSPLVRIVADSAERTALEWHLAAVEGPDGPPSALTAAGLAAGAAGAFAVSWGTLSGPNFWVGQVVAGGLAAGAVGWLWRALATVRVTVFPGRGGAGRVRRSAGVGPIRYWRTTRAGRVRAVATGFPLEMQSLERPGPPRCRACLVLRDVPPWLGLLLQNRTAPLLSGGGEPGAAAAADVAVRVTAALHRLGWQARGCPTGGSVGRNRGPSEKAGPRDPTAGLASRRECRPRSRRGGPAS